MDDQVMAYCSFRDCSEVAERVQEDGMALCPGHRKQRSRGQPLTPLAQPMTPTEALLMAAGDWAEAEEDDEYRRAKERAVAACLRLARSMGWKPPRPVKPRPCCCGLVQLALPLRQRRPRRVPARAYPVT